MPCPDSSANVSSAPWATPSDTAAVNTQFTTIVRRGAYSGLACCEATRCRRAGMCSSGTNTSLTSTSWLPVPRRPATCQVSMMCASAIGTLTLRSRRRPSSSDVQVGKYQSAWRELLAKSQRPSTTKPPSTRRASPSGRFDPAKRRAPPTVPGAKAASP